jgi:hypothetical protein
MTNPQTEQQLSSKRVLACAQDFVVGRTPPDGPTVRAPRTPAKPNPARPPPPNVQLKRTARPSPVALPSLPSATVPQDQQTLLPLPLQPTSQPHNFPTAPPVALQGGLGRLPAPNAGLPGPVSAPVAAALGPAGE